MTTGKTRALTRQTFVGKVISLLFNMLSRLVITFLPRNIQDGFPLGLTGLISSQFKGLTRVFSNITFQSISSLALSLLYGPVLTSIHDYWRNYSFDNTDLCGQSDISLLFNTLSRFVIAFLSKSKNLLFLRNLIILLFFLLVDTLRVIY